MVLSMTGFGQSSGSFQNRQISVEIKTLNGKTADIRVKSPMYYKEKEMEIRKSVMKALVRGKMDVSINVSSETEDVEYSLNKNLFKKYINDLVEISGDLDIDKGDLLQTVIKIPNIVKANDEQLSAEEWAFTKELIQQTVERIKSYRQTEGESIYQDLKESVDTIANLLKEVPEHEEERQKILRARMMKHLDEFINKENVDRNRFEQEVIHYMERLDINEEKVRLEQHCKYFIEELHSDNNVLGKKLGFIAQEIGREINTMGAKAQYSPLQKIVVNMKDNLEKMKEQLANAV